MRRGELWVADLPKPIGKRPVVLLSRDEAYRVRNAITVAQVTKTIRNIPVEVALSEKDGMTQKCVINLDTITTVRKSVLIKRICLLKTEKIAKMNEAIKFALDLD